MNTAAGLMILCTGIGYLLGSLPFAVLVSRAMGLADPRRYGSGNPGATNVLRGGNKVAAALTLAGDALKGWLAMIVAAALGASASAVGMAGLAAFCGHLFPLFLKFRGGKGVATALGVLAGFSGTLALAAALVWLVVAGISRYSSLAALCAAVAAPGLAWWLTTPMNTGFVLLISLLLLFRHRANIARLLHGTETRIGQ